MWLRLILAQLALCTLSSSMTHTGRMGREASRVSTTLVFEITTKPGMHCFHQEFVVGSRMRIGLAVVNSQGQHLHMRISSPTEIFSEWYEGIDRIEYNGNATETGDHEICVTAKIGFGSLRVSLELFAYNLVEIEAAFKEYMEKNNVQTSLQEVIDRIFDKTYQTFYSIRYYNFMSKRDTHLQERNINYIDAFSTVQTIFMIASGITQVFIIRKFFYVDTRKIRI